MRCWCDAEGEEEAEEEEEEEEEVGGVFGEGRKVSKGRRLRSLGVLGQAEKNAKRY